MIEQVSIGQGRLSATRTGAAASAFLGVPYAAPPLGALRWRPPEVGLSWNGIRRADAFQAMALQYLPCQRSLFYPGNNPQSEDCLYLNIWTSAEEARERRPVMIWFHLGAFMFGSASWRPNVDGPALFDGSALAAAGAVVVTVNYRLLRFGFLAHPWLTAESETQSSGNYGFLDQVAALRWVRDNIEQFGGDPDNVTIFGVSAGSASCSMHMASPLSKGLFHRAVGGSGAFMAPSSSNSRLCDRMLDLATAEARGVELTEGMQIDSLETLRALPAESVMNAQISSDTPYWSLEMSGIPVGNRFSDTMYPIVDGYALPAAEADIFEAGRHNDVPLLTGSTAGERSGLPSIGTLERYRAYLTSEYGDQADAFLATYPADDDASAVRASGDLLGDRVFCWQNWTWARLAHKHGASPVYYYDWVHKPPIPVGRYVEGQPVAGHSSEMVYLFNNLRAYDWDWTDYDRNLASIMSKYWLNFALTGDPNGEGLPSWEKFQGAEGPALEIGETITSVSPPRTDRYALLDRHYNSDDGAS